MDAHEHSKIKCWSEINLNIVKLFNSIMMIMIEIPLLFVCLLCEKVHTRKCAHYILFNNSTKFLIAEILIPNTLKWKENIKSIFRILIIKDNNCSYNWTFVDCDNGSSLSSSLLSWGFLTNSCASFPYLKVLQLIYINWKLKSNVIYLNLCCCLWIFQVDKSTLRTLNNKAQ